MIVVLHRERSEKLARRFIEALGEQNRSIYATADGTEAFAGAFDALIQEGLIGEQEPRPEGRP